MLDAGSSSTSGRSVMKDQYEKYRKWPTYAQLLYMRRSVAVLYWFYTPVPKNTEQETKYSVLGDLSSPFKFEVDRGRVKVREILRKKGKMPFHRMQGMVEVMKQNYGGEAR